MLRERGNFATKVLSTESLEEKSSSLKKRRKKLEEKVKSLSFPSCYLVITSLKVTSSGKLLYL